MNSMRETVKITNRNQMCVVFFSFKTKSFDVNSCPQSLPVTPDGSDYQLFVNGKETISVMQSAPEASHGRNINVYSYEVRPA